MPRVLIVDDDASMRKLLVRALDREFECEQAVSGAHARKKLTESAFDVVLFDLVMIDGSGADLLDFIRTMEAPPAPIVLSALAERWVQQHGEAKDYVVLSKPIDLDVLVTAVRRQAK